MHLLIAPDKFKDSLSAAAAAAIMAEAVLSCRPHWTVDACPLTDGGDGFVHILTESAGGVLETFRVTGPRGSPVEARLGWVQAKHLTPAVLERLRAAESVEQIAVIEMAEASGLRLLAEVERNPWHTSTRGTGQLLRRACEGGADLILLGVGGSATNDLGCGALAALGWRFFDRRGTPIVDPVPSRWWEIEYVEGGGALALPPIRIASDVTHPLLGPGGCTRVFGPQKGLPVEETDRMESAVMAMADKLERAAGVHETGTMRPGAGAAGGIAFGLGAAIGALILPGFDLVSAWLNLAERISRADVVLTGEGAFDATSLAGKGPGSVVGLGLAEDKNVHVFAGRVSVPSEDPRLHLHAITPPGLPLEDALRGGGANLQTAVVFVASNLTETPQPNPHRL